MSARPLHVTVVPHTHWDREWYLTFEGFLERLVPMMDGLLEQADRGFPHFHLDGQTAMVDDYLAVRPERAEDLRRHAAGGRLSIGPWFTQMDEFLVSGESLIRNLEWGMARAEELGAPQAPGYLPDEFGHIGQMPQILANAGVEHAVVWRGVPESIDTTTFTWEAPDGSRVQAEYLAFGYTMGGRLRDAHKPAKLARLLQDSAAHLTPFSVRDGLLLTAGADHHGPDPTLAERLREATRHGEVEAEIGSLADYLRRPITGELPVWRGELRSSARAPLLPNVYSNRAPQKVRRAWVEALVERYAEPLAALVPGMEWPADELERAWRLLLWNGAHDSACGCSVDEVARAVDDRFDEAEELGLRIQKTALEALAARVSAPGELWFNPSPFERDGVLGLGWTVRPAAAPDAPISEVRVDDAGRIAIEGMTLRLLDEADVGDLYNFCPAEGDAPREPDSLTVERDVAIARWDGLEVRVYAAPLGDTVVVNLDVQNERPDHRLRLHVALPEPVETVLAGSPFEIAERGLVSEGGIETPSRTWPARGFVLAGDLAVMSRGVFEYEVTEDGELAATLLRCVGTISRMRLATRAWAAGPDMPTPEAQLIGTTRARLGLRPGTRREDLIEAWERFALPLVSARAPGGGELPATGTLLETDLGGGALSSIRRVDDQTEVRVWNPGHDTVHARVGERTIGLGPARVETLTL